MKLVFAPDWFLNADILIEGFSFIVLFVFFLICLKNYKLNKKRSFLHLGIGFLLIALAQLSTILTKLVLYYHTNLTQQIGVMIVTYQIVKSVDIFYNAGFFFNRFLTLTGFYIIYRLHKKGSPIDFFLALYFITLSVLLSSSFYYLYHITVFIFLILIIDNYFKIYKRNKHINTKILIMAFSVLALSQAILILSKLSFMYVLANVLELLSYITLLVLIIRILKSTRVISRGKKRK